MTDEAWKVIEEALGAIRGDPQAAWPWTTFYRLVSPTVRGQLFLLGARQPHLVDDLSQDVLLRFLRYSPWRHDWQSLPPAQAVIGYIREITRTVYLDHVSRDGSVAQPTDLPEKAEWDDLPAGPTTSDLTVTLHRWWGRLSNEERLLLRLLIEGHKLNDIASILGVSYSAAGVRVHRLKTRLHEL